MMQLDVSEFKKQMMKKIIFQKIFSLLSEMQKHILKKNKPEQTTFMITILQNLVINTQIAVTKNSKPLMLIIIKKMELSTLNTKDMI